MLISACAMGLVHQRSDKCVEKLIEIEESQTDEYEKFEKKCPEGLENVYDIGFCVKVSWSFYIGFQPVKVILET